GLDYYTLTVFEVVSERLGAQNAILGGGRYDDLVQHLGGPPTSAIGFAIGEDRLVEAMTIDARPQKTLFYVIPDSAEQFLYALGISNDIRACDREAIVETDFQGRGIVKGLSRAGQIASDPSRHAFRVARVQAVLLGVNESDRGEVTIKDLSSSEQQTFPRKELAERLGAARER
ncbi:MAG: ATP phosphoribosyltransferase regulatory subunit, partial [Acidobacteriota bacterium]